MTVVGAVESGAGVVEARVVTEGDTSTYYRPLKMLHDALYHFFASSGRFKSLSTQ